MRRSLMLAALTATTACATAATPRDPQAAIARLEQARAKNPSSVATLRALGIALYTAKQYPGARAVLDEARKADPKDGLSALYAGLTAEAQEDTPGAKEAYTAYLSTGKSSKARDQIRTRLAFVARQELTLAAQAALKQEVALSAEQTNPKTIAVPPFRFSGADSTLKPLERGMADLLITDLSRAKEITVVERDRMQALVDEVALSQGNRVDANTSVRAGRLIRAGRVVQGGITQTGSSALQLNASVVDVPTAQTVGSATQNDQLEQLFAMEKKLAFDLFDQLKVTLSPEERTALQEARPTRSLPAFLAYSRGLMAEDRGDFSGAALLYQDAVRIDPGFIRATIRQQTSSSITAGAQVTSGTVETGLQGTGEGNTADNAKQGNTGSGAPGAAPTAVSVVNNLNPNASGANTGATEPAAGSTTTGGGTTTAPPTNQQGQNPNKPPAPPTTVTGTITIIIRQP